MYIHHVATHGFNDILSRLIWFERVCKMYNRIMLIDGENGTYMVNFSDYFTFAPHITDSAKIARIMKRHPVVTVPPMKAPPVEMVGQLLGNHPIVSFVNLKHFIMAYPIFKQLSFKPCVKEECNRRRALLGDKYLGIQVRNTDHQCDYQSLYESNKELIHSYPSIYLATDCKEVIAFFKSKNVVFQNFITFQTDNNPLHLSSGVSSPVRFMDMLCDLYLVAMAHMVLSNSKGKFIRLIKACNQDKEYVKTQFE
jgi:hypothetical protein